MNSTLKRRIGRPILFLLLGVFVAVVLLEVFLRIFDPIGVRYYFDTRRYFSAMTPDPDYGYIHTPGYQAKLQSVEVSINQHGFRGPDFPMEKGAQEKRLMILGDSVVFGWGVAQDAILSAVLERKIEQEGFDNWSVIGSGVGSWNTRTECEYLKREGAQFQPDILVLVIVPNDVEPKDVGRTAVSRDQLETAQVSPGHRIVRFIGRQSYVFSAFHHVLRLRDQADHITKLYEADSPAWEDARQALYEIDEICRSQDIELFAFLYGDMSTDFSRAFYMAYAQQLIELKVPSFVVNKRVYEEDFRNSKIDGHPNAAGHSLIADQMFEALKSWL